MQQSSPHKSSQKVHFQFGHFLHKISHLKILFYALGLFFQAKTMLFSKEPAFFDNLNFTLLMYGIAMAFQSLCDFELLPQKQRLYILTKINMFQLLIAFLFVGGLFSILLGCMLLVFFEVKDLPWAMVTFGLGMVSIGRQQFDQMHFVLASSDNNSQ